MGVGGKLGPAKGAASINLYQVVKAAQNYVQAAVDYVEGKLSEAWPQ